MKKLLIPLSVYLLSITVVFAQHEADNWYFGDRAGITFKDDSVKAIDNGELFSTEGCAAISDKNTGELLFYSNGSTVWNRNHEIMENGVGVSGGSSASQGVMIVPNPGNDKKYYIFTAPDLSGYTSGGFNYSTKLLYSEVSFLENPLGKITIKNFPLLDSAGEKVTATLNCSETGYWVVTHHLNHSSFYAFHVTKAGIDIIPVVSTYSNQNTLTPYGYIRISSNRTKIAIVSTFNSSTVSLFDFNPQTGEIANRNQLINEGQVDYCYGLEFSPDNSKLYITGKLKNIFPIEYTLFQFNLNTQSADQIANSLYIQKLTGGANAALQLAPDGKIYIAESGLQSLGIIENPNLKELECGYHQSAFILKGKSKSLGGLPNFMDYIFNQPIPNVRPLSWCAPRPPKAVGNSDSGCVGSTLTFIDNSILNPTNREWIFENGTPPTSTDSIVSVTYSKPGEHNVLLKVSNFYGSDSVLLKAVIFPLPTANAGFDKTICRNKSTQIGVHSEDDYTYSWEPSTNMDYPKRANPNVNPDGEGIFQYILTVTSKEGCISKDTVNITVGNIKAKVSGDTAVCIGSSVQLNASGGEEYQWTPIEGLDNPNIPNPTASPQSTTTYKVRVFSSDCVDSATVKVTVNKLPIATAGTDIDICYGETSRIGSLTRDGFTYSWQPSIGLDDPSKSNPLASPFQSTNYILTVVNGTGCIAKDTVLVTVNPLPIANAGPNQTLCKGETSQLGELPQDGYKYLWQPTTGLDNPTKSNPLVTPSESNIYILTVTNSNGCTSKDTTEIVIRNTLKVNVSADTSICLGASVQLSASGGTRYQWLPIDGLDNPTIANPVATPKESTQYKVVVSNGFCIDSTFINVTVKPLPIAYSGPDRTLCIGEASQLGVSPQPGYKYNWQPVSGLDYPEKSNPTLTALESGEYILSVVNSDGCQSTDTVVITVVQKDERKFTLSPQLITFTPGTSFQTDLNVPSGIKSWKAYITYDSMLFKFVEILQTSIGITVTSYDQNGRLQLNGEGDNGNVALKFATYLPNTPDTIFVLGLTVDSSAKNLCNVVTAEGNTLQLNEYCGRRVRMVSSTGKRYYLSAKENGVNFGVGLPGNVRIELYDYRGMVKQILANEPLTVGEYSINFDLPTGLYFCHISSGMYDDVVKVMIIR